MLFFTDWQRRVLKLLLWYPVPMKCVLFIFWPLVTCFQCAFDSAKVAHCLWSWLWYAWWGEDRLLIMEAFQLASSAGDLQHKPAAWGSTPEVWSRGSPGTSLISLCRVGSVPASRQWLWMSWSHVIINQDVCLSLSCPSWEPLLWSISN